jgi:broad specificity phosphatase PhoE
VDPAGVRRYSTTALARVAPEQRARDTASALDLDAVVEPSLADLDVGAWRGRALADIEADDRAGAEAWRADPSAAPHGGESVADLVARVDWWLRRCLADGPEQVLAVTHPAVVRGAIVSVMGAPLASFWNVDARPLTATVLTADGSRWALRSHGIS